MAKETLYRKIEKAIKKAKKESNHGFNSKYNLARELNKIFDNFNDYKDDEGKNIMHLLPHCKIGLKQLKKIYMNLMENPWCEKNLINAKDSYGNTFMYDLIMIFKDNPNFIIEILDKALMNKFDVNTINVIGDTIFHTYLKMINTIDNNEIEIINTLIDFDYDPSIINNNNESLIDIIERKFEKNNYCLKLLEIIKSNTKSEQIQRKKENDEKIRIEVENNKIQKELKEIDSTTYLMNNKKYKTTPSIGRDKEVELLMITLANKKKSALIVGESGVGKTTIVDEIVYRVINNRVPNFLKGKKIIEINPTSLVAGTQFRGTFERKLVKIIELCLREDIILFIDEIHEIYGAGTCITDDSNDMASILKYYIDRTDLKIIGTTTKEEYNKYFSNDALKRRFDVIRVKEPDKDSLKLIISKVFNDMTLEYNIGNSIINDKIIDILIEITEKRKYDDPINNPDFVISIIDKAYSYAYYNSNEELTLNDLIYSILANDRIYDSVKERYIKELRSISINSLEKTTKRKVLNFNDYVNK